MRNNIYNLRNLKKVNYSEIGHTFSRNSVIIRKLSSVDIWGDFNTFLRADGVSSSDVKTTNELVSGSDVKNYLFKDPIIDILKSQPETVRKYQPQTRAYHRQNKELNFEKKQIEGKFFKLTNHVIHFSSNNKMNIPMQKGLKYETKVYEKLVSLYGDKVECIMVDTDKLVVDDYIRTFDAMKRGIPIIYQGILYNPDNLTFGVADFIVRSDFINKIFDNEVLTKSEEKIPALNLGKSYHYVIIDAKWTTMQLCADGIHIRNSDRFPAYKSQLAIYTAALGVLQGYIPDKAYVLAKSYKFSESGTEYRGYDSFDRLGVIDYSGFDQNYISRTAEALQWLRNVRQNGHSMSVDPPELPESYPNMCNSYDSPYHKLKVDLAKKYGELTQLWYVGPKNRKIAFSNNIRSITDRRCSAKLLGVNGPKQGKILDKIIKINRSSTRSKIEPKKIKNNIHDWQGSNNFELYIDFETIEGCLMSDRMDLSDSKEATQVLFMIGVGYIENSQWVYKSFSMDRYTINEEQKIVQEFVDYVTNVVNNKRTPQHRSMPILYHWGNAEKSILNNVNKRHNFRWSNWLKDIVLLDFCKIFRDEPITIKGSLNFGLKSISKAMHSHGFITTIWGAGPSNGLQAMEDAVQHYRFMREYDNSPVGKTALYSNYQTSFKNIINYNEVDCKVLYEIIKYVKNKMT